MIALAVFAMLAAFVSGVFVIGLLSNSRKASKYSRIPPDQLSLPMQGNAEKRGEMASAHR